jgi:hypothetical protein
MRAQINKEKSILKRRLVYKHTTELLLNRLFENFIWVALLLVPILILMNKKNNIPIEGLVVLISFCLFLLIGIYFINCLVVIDGVNLEENRTKIIKLIQEKYPELQVDGSGQNIISCRKQAGITTWGKQITVIFDNNQMLINLTTLGRNNIKSPFHALFNNMKMRSLKSKFKNG